MKKSFTLIELVFVIVVISIIAMAVLPRINTNNLHEAAIQVVSHIRYTQHLAMTDDKYDPDEALWFHRRWTIRFHENLTFTNVLPPDKSYQKVWAYTIFSDLPDYNRHHPDLNGMARSPSNFDQYLSGGVNNTLHVEDTKSMKRMRLGIHYGIEDVAFSGGCRSNVRYIHFDHLGRPMNSFPENKPYESASAGWHKLIHQRCVITLTSKNDESLAIAIEPETGYAHILY
jgi:type II secretory pathway pseudopilin PulG